jgi:hypothetical protein
MSGEHELKKQSIFMSDPEKKINIRSTSIPAIFYKSDTGEPFSECISCTTNLLITNTPYIIEKAIKQYRGFHSSDTIFEYAICMHCYEELGRAMSEESKKNINDYYQINVDFESRRNQLTNSIDEWISECLIKHTRRSQLSEYQIIGQFQANQMLYYNLPILLSEEAIDEMMQLLSNATLDEMGRFKDRFLGIPPEWRDLFEDRKFVFL